MRKSLRNLMLLMPLTTCWPGAVWSIEPNPTGADLQFHTPRRLSDDPLVQGKPVSPLPVVRKEAPIKPIIAITSIKKPLRAQSGKATFGLASWYGGKDHGQATASGQRFNMHDLTAAHSKLPLMSYARVTNLSNGKSVIVCINDRIGNNRRIIDLSHRAAKILGFIKKGLTRVKIEPVTHRPSKKRKNPIKTSAKA